MIECTSCHTKLSIGDISYRCQACGGVFDYAESFVFENTSTSTKMPGIWRHRDFFGLPEEIEPISLGEGNSPLIWDDVNGKQVAFKLDYLNPTGSYKDRGTTVLISYLSRQGVTSAIEDSSGNAGASFAAYCSRAGINGKVFVPAYASGPKRAQIEAYGGELVSVPGPRSNAAEAVRQEAELGAVYASHVYQPFVLPGFATAAYEMVEQLGDAPGSVIAPVGQGSFLLGMARGFEALYNAGQISRMPQLIGVQSKACAPLWNLARDGEIGLDGTEEGETIAEGIRIRHPVRGKAIVKAVKSSHGFMAAVDEIDIIPARDELANRGFYVEPTSAVIWPVLLSNLNELPDPIVMVLTGSGLKYMSSENN